MKHQDLPERWKQKVASFLSEKGETQYKTLSASDFPSDQKVRMKFEDDSFAEFLYAFIIEAPEWREIGLFTEHCGYHIFNSSAVEIEVIEVKNDE